MVDFNKMLNDTDMLTITMQGGEQYAVKVHNVDTSRTVVRKKTFRGECAHMDYKRYANDLMAGYGLGFTEFL